MRGWGERQRERGGGEQAANKEHKLSACTAQDLKPPLKLCLTPTVKPLETLFVFPNQDQNTNKQSKTPPPLCLETKLRTLCIQTSTQTHFARAFASVLLFLLLALPPLPLPLSSPLPPLLPSPPSFSLSPSLKRKSSPVRDSPSWQLSSVVHRAAIAPSHPISLCFQIHVCRDV